MIRYRSFRNGGGRILTREQRLERHRQMLENLRRGAHATRVPPSATPPKDEFRDALQSPQQPALFS